MVDELHVVIGYDAIVDYTCDKADASIEEVELEWRHNLVLVQLRQVDVLEALTKVV